MSFFRRVYKPKVKDIVRVNAVADRKNFYRLDPMALYVVTEVDKKKKEVVVVKYDNDTDRGVEGWTVYFSDVELYGKGKKTKEKEVKEKKVKEKKVKEKKVKEKKVRENKTKNKKKDK